MNFRKLKKENSSYMKGLMNNKYSNTTVNANRERETTAGIDYNDNAYATNYIYTHMYTLQTYIIWGRIYRIQRSFNYPLKRNN